MNTYIEEPICNYFQRQYAHFSMHLEEQTLLFDIDLTQCNGELNLSHRRHAVVPVRDVTATSNQMLTTATALSNARQPWLRTGMADCEVRHDRVADTQCHFPFGTLASTTHNNLLIVDLLGGFHAVGIAGSDFVHAFCQAILTNTQTAEIVVPPTKTAKSTQPVCFQRTCQ